MLVPVRLLVFTCGDQRPGGAASVVLVAGVDSSTQSCKVVVCDSATGAVVREGRVAHPDGTEVDTRHWWSALEEASAAAGGLDDVAVVAVAAQQHGLVCLDEHGAVARPALVRNDTRSGPSARALLGELGEGHVVVGGAAWAEAVGVVPVAAITVSKLRWVADHEPQTAARHCGGVPAARLAVMAPARLLRHRCAGHAPRRRERDRVLVPEQGPIGSI